MFLIMSKILYVLFIFYISWFQTVFTSIPRVPLILGAGMIYFWVISEFFKTTNSKIVFPKPVMFWFIFSFYILLSGSLIVTNKLHFFDSWFTYIQNLILIFYMINISKRDGNNLFFLITQFFLSCVYMITMLFWGYIGKGGRLQLAERSNANGDGLTLLFGIFVILLLSNKNKIWNMIISISVISLFIYTISLTGSRKSFVAAILMLIVWFLFVYKEYWKSYTILKKIISLTILFSIILTSLYILLPLVYESPFYTRFIDRGISISNDVTRAGMYKEAIGYFYDNPLFGVGYKQFENISTYNTYSHSTYAEIASTTGLIGTIIYFIPYLIIIIELYKIYKNNKRTKYSIEAIEALQYLVLMLILIILGTGVIHFYGIRYFVMFGLMISFYTTTKYKIHYTDIVLCNEELS